MDEVFALLGAIPVLVVALYLCVKLIKKAFPFVLNAYAEPPLKSDYKKDVREEKTFQGINPLVIGGVILIITLILIGAGGSSGSNDSIVIILWFTSPIFIYLLRPRKKEGKKYKETSTGKEYVDLNKEKSGGIIYKDISHPSSKKNK